MLPFLPPNLCGDPDNFIKRVVNPVKSHEKVQIRQQDPIYPGNPGYFGGQQGGSPYPGLDQSFFGGTPNWPAAYTPPQSPSTGGGLLGGLFGGGGGAGAAGSGSGGFNLNQVKGFIDRMGGIDGIVGTMTRVQKVVSSFQQMAPMLKLLMGSFAGAKASAKSVGGKYDGLAYPKRKRRKNTKRTLKKRNPTASQTWTRKGKKRR
jgi:hypothetical protein